MRNQPVEHYADNAPIWEKLNWQIVVRNGLIAGVVLLYVGVIGMLEAFNDREVIRDIVTLGQLLIFVPAILLGYITARRLTDDGSNIMIAILSGGVVGILASLPSLLMLGLAEATDIRDILVNVNRDWQEIITFDNRNEPIRGGLYLFGALIVSGFGGSILSQFPQKLRGALIWAIMITLTVGTMGNTVSQIVEQIGGDDLVDAFFQRDALLRNPAIALFVISFISTFAWSVFGKTVNQQYQQLPKQQRSTAQIVAYLMLLGFLLILPFLVGRALSDVLVTVGLFVLMGFGLNIAIGLAGLLDLGYVTNYAVGAYVMAVLTSTGVLGRGPEFLNFWFVLPIALLSAMFAGFIFAVPVLKMRGDYLAIATLGFGEIIGKLAVSDWLRPIIGGAQGVLGVPNANFFGTELNNPEQLYYVVLGACILTLFVSIRLNNSRTGRQWMAIREDEDVAAAMGINTARAKLLAFTLSAATGGLAGAIFVAKVNTVFPNSFTVFISINVLSLIIVGGMGSNPGIVVGALVLVGAPELLREFSEYRWLLYGALLIFMMVNRPEGLVPSQVTRREIASGDGINDPTLDASMPKDSQAAVS